MTGPFLKNTYSSAQDMSLSDCKSDEARIHLMLFFTLGVSLEDWAKLGLLKREVGSYQALATGGVRVTFVTYGNEKDLDYASDAPGISIFPLFLGSTRPKSRLGMLLLSLILPLRLRTLVQKADLLKTNQMWGAWVPLICGRLFSLPVLLRCGFERYQNELREPRGRVAYLFLLRTISRLCYQAAEHIILTTEAMARFVVDEMKIRRDKISVIPNSINTDRFCPSSGSTNGRLLFVGRLSKEKNLSALVDALTGTGIGLDLVGSGPEEDNIRERIRKAKIDAELLGSVSNDKLPELITRYQAFILPSLYEGHPKAILEAMSCGLPVIGTDVPGIRGLITHEKNGLLADTDYLSLRSAIQTLMSDLKLQHHLGTSARERIVQDFDLGKVARRETDIIHSICSTSWGVLQK